jgi:UDP-2-acetamido-2,6-beta-L-arabino-hexul-4-ose reductase
MKTVLVTGAKGFIGRNLMEALARRDGIAAVGIDADDGLPALKAALGSADIVYHLAGVNRPEKEEDFFRGNTDATSAMLAVLSDLNRAPAIVLASSSQAALDNPYGISKKRAEDLIADYGERAGAPVYIYRLTNVFGKWCRPNYNSVVATFCHNVARGLDIRISDRSREIRLVYIDDVVASFLSLLDRPPQPEPCSRLGIEPSYRLTLGELVDRIQQLKDIRRSLVVPDFSDGFTRCLYATYLSYLAEDDFAYGLDQKKDTRGALAELIKNRHFGQIFVSRTHGGVIRGNHYHNTKVEKFCVLQGQAAIRFRHIHSQAVLTYRVCGEDMQIVDIPPGYTHSIENLSDQEMIVLFWADQIFDPAKPDTYPCEVETAKK